MAKLNPANLAPDALPRLRGVVITYINKFGVVAQKWPRKRGPITNFNVAWTSNQFAIASRMAANAEPMSMETARYMTQGTVWLPRDMLVMAAFGKAIQLVSPEGDIYTQADHGPPPPTPVEDWRVTATAALVTNEGGWGGYTLRQRINAAALTNLGGSRSRITFQASSTASGFTIADAYIGLGATSGDSYDFDGSPTRLQFGGNNGGAAAMGAALVSDPVAFVPLAGRNLVVSMAFTGTSSLKSLTPLTDWQSYYKFGNDAATVDASGYTTWAPATCVALIETDHA